VLLVLGERDNPVPEPDRMAEKARRLIAGVTVEIIPGAGHLMSSEEPGIVNELVVGFLAD
jgi:pimeloyl-ACP methyl ester carboxylesterase